MLVVAPDHWDDPTPDENKEAVRNLVEEGRSQEVPRVAQVAALVSYSSHIVANLVDAHSYQEKHSAVNDYAHDPANLLVVLNEVRSFLRDEVADLEEDDRLQVLLEDQERGIWTRTGELKHVSQGHDELKDEQEDENGGLDFGDEGPESYAAPVRSDVKDEQVHKGKGVDPCKHHDRQVSSTI